METEISNSRKREPTSNQEQPNKKQKIDNQQDLSEQVTSTLSRVLAGAINTPTDHRDVVEDKDVVKAMIKLVPTHHNQDDLTYLELFNQNPQKQSHIQTTLTSKGHLTT